MKLCQCALQDLTKVRSCGYSDFIAKIMKGEPLPEQVFIVNKPGLTYKRMLTMTSIFENKNK